MLTGSLQIHARLGELHYMAAIAPGAGQGIAAGGSYQRHMVEAVKRFARSIELCDDYLRGYYGLKLVSRNRSALRRMTCC